MASHSDHIIFCLSHYWENFLNNWMTIRSEAPLWTCFLHSHSQLVTGVLHVFKKNQFILLPVYSPPPQLHRSYGQFVLVCTTVCPRSSDPFYVVTYYIKWVTTSWTHSICVVICICLRLTSSKLQCRWRRITEIFCIFNIIFIITKIYFSFSF